MFFQKYYYEIFKMGSPHFGKEVNPITEEDNIFFNFITVRFVYGI